MRDRTRARSVRYVREAKSDGGAALFRDATGTATHIDATTREDGYVQRGSTIEKAVLRYFYMVGEC